MGAFLAHSKDLQSLGFLESLWNGVSFYQKWLEPRKDKEQDEGKPCHSLSRPAELVSFRMGTQRICCSNTAGHSPVWYHRTWRISPWGNSVLFCNQHRNVRGQTFSFKWKLYCFAGRKLAEMLFNLNGLSPYYYIQVFFSGQPFVCVSTTGLMLQCFRPCLGNLG